MAADVFAVVAGSNKVAGDLNPRPYYYDKDVEDVKDKLEGIGIEVERALSLFELSEVIQTRLDRGPKPDQIHIIGHGSPGTLSLGYALGTPYKHRQEVYALDSNPFHYSVLKPLVLSEIDVVLFGCMVGKEKMGSIADGGLLVFDLARMWQTRVYAPTVPVGALNYSETGEIENAQLLCSDGNTLWKSAAPTEDDFGPQKNFEADLVKAPVFAGFRGENISEMRETQQSSRIIRERLNEQHKMWKEMCASFTKKVTGESPSFLGIPTFELSVKWDGLEWEATIFGGQSAARLQRNGQPPILLLSETQDDFEIESRLLEIY